MLEAAIAAGVTAAGGDALLAGVLPTPAAPLLRAPPRLDLAAVISASHNPYEDNGIKLFAADGFKLRRRRRAGDRGRARAAARRQRPDRTGAHAARGARGLSAGARTPASSSWTCSGRRILLDCANGATYRAAPEIFRRLGAEVEVLADQPDGRNINDGCGSTHLELIARTDRAAARSTLGFAFDGDGDRVLAVDRSGAIVDGDELIALAARAPARAWTAAGGGVAVTVMTNYGFHTAMGEAGIEVATHRGRRPLRAR